MFALFGAEVSGLEGPALGSSLVGLPGFCLGGPIGHGGLLPERPGGVVGGGPWLAGVVGGRGFST